MNNHLLTSARLEGVSPLSGSRFLQEIQTLGNVLLALTDDTFCLHFFWFFYMEYLPTTECQEVYTSYMSSP